MRQFTGYLVLSFAVLCMIACTEGKSKQLQTGTNDYGQPFYQDKPYLQEFSIKYLADKTQQASLVALSTNRDGQVRLLTNRGVLVPDNGSMFYSGGLTPDVSYIQLLSKKITAIGTYHNQTFYLDNRQLFSNAWAGKIQIDHGLAGARLFAGGDDFQFLISDGENLAYFNQAGEKLWTGTFRGLLQIRYFENHKSFLLVSAEKVAEYTPGQTIQDIYSGTGITCASGFNGNKIMIGTNAGYLVVPGKDLVTKLPCTEITTLQEINGQMWFGSTHGAFRLNANGKFSYYAGERWIPGNRVIAIEAGPEQSVLVLTEHGIGKICRKMMTLEEKAMFFEKQVREKNIRYGFNSSSSRLINSYSSGQTGAQPSDNLWTSMYLASQLYRYKVTGSEEARQNARESFEAMERLFTVTGIEGLFARSYECDYKVDTVRKPGWEKREWQSGSPASLWLPARDHSNWT